MNRINTRKALNPAYRKNKPLRKGAQQPFIEKVNQILALKKANPKADTS